MFCQTDFAGHHMNPFDLLRDMLDRRDYPVVKEHESGVP